MIRRIVFPVFDANITEGMVGRWMVAEGDRIAPGDPLAEIVTDKATFTLEADEEGIVRRIVATEKSVVPNGYILALIGEADDEVPDVAAENDAIVEASRKQMTGAPSPPPSSQPPPRRPTGPARRVRATPAARRLAKEHGIDLSAIYAEEPITEQAVRDHIVRQ